MLGKKLDIGKRRTCGRKAGGCFDEIRAGVGDHLAHGDFFLVGQQAGFNDHLEYLVAHSCFQAADFVGHIRKVTGLEHADIDDHIDLLRAVCEGLTGFKLLGSRRRIAVGKSHHGTNGHLALHVLMRLRHITGRNTYRRGAIGDGLVTQILNLRPGRGLLEQRMVHHGAQFFCVHRYILLYSARRRCPGACPAHAGTALCSFVAVRSPLV